MNARLPLLLCALALPGPAAPASPYTPADDGQLVETLPSRNDPAQRALRRLRAELSARPRDLALAVDLASRYIGAARGASDPRYLGYAEAALAPWWALAAPPPPVRLLRATVLQSNHHFAQALADLDAVLGAEPGNAQAWLTRATVLTVQGDYRRASTGCARLSALANELVSITCIAAIGSVTGRAAQSEQLLERTLQRSAGAAPEQQVWALTLLAEMAARRGAGADAEARFLRALALAPQDAYLLGAYADLLLDQQRPADVLRLLQDQGRIDALLLRHALALRQTAGAQAALAAEQAELAARFDAALQRGDSVHRREQARFELQLRRDAPAALALARRNWAVQKEPADLRLYLDAALQAHDAGAAAPALAWIATHGVEDVAARRLARALKELP